ncbi:TIGR02996 domain-containing protein [Gemmata sp.]|uniref:TIGR02996 domain-containing protein n=1 Tax=Gemmata sp. TaxID=1914242 RepID=UPI003F6FD8D3
MATDPERLAFLRAIAAAPDDNTPRLAYADWLDEHSSSDADRARAEFLRIACKHSTKARITKDEQVWLAAHWQRMLPTVAALFVELGGKPDGIQWSGRNLKLWVASRKRSGRAVSMSLELEVWRGFVRRVVYHEGFDTAASAVAADEPLARHELFPELLPYPRPLAGGRFRVGVAPAECFGQVVWDRIVGHAAVSTTSRGEVKMFDAPEAGPLTRVELHRTALDAIARAMTAHARTLTGWPTDLPTLF